MVPGPMLPASRHFLLPGASSKDVVLFLEPDELGFQVANTLPETAHLGDHAGIGTAGVTG